LKADRKAYQDQKQVQKLGNQRGDGSTGNAHSGGTQLSEDEQIVQPGVRRYRAKTCPKGDSGVFLAAQPCGQDGADRHGQIRERLGVLLRTQKLCDQNAGIAGGAVPQGFKAADGSPCPERRILMNGGQSGEGSHCKTPFSPLPQQGPARIKFLPAQRRCGNRLSAPCPLYRFLSVHSTTLRSHMGGILFH
jgi:hypothetical protein